LKSLHIRGNWIRVKRFKIDIHYWGFLDLDYYFKLGIWGLDCTGSKYRQKKKKIWKVRSQKFQHLERSQPAIEIPPCTITFITALFTVAKLWNQPRFLWADEWVKKKVVYIHNEVLFSHIEEWNNVICRKMDGIGDHFK
jgi:hypothetical protein